MIDPHIFRAYDIRGKAGTQITPDVAELVGRAFGSTLRENYRIDHPTVIVGRDARMHGPALETAVINGLKKTGCSVHRIGQTPSPVNYFILTTTEFDGSIQVTASHNPADDNGLKLQTRQAEAFAGTDIERLRDRIEREEFLEGEGTVVDLDAITPYIKHISKMFAGIGAGKKIVVDSGNGVAGPAYVDVMKRAGAEVIGLYIEPDGSFPNHAADPSKLDTLKALQERVRKEKAQLGFAFDGDGDRMGAVDENGKIVTADEILLLLAEDHLKRHAGAPVVFTVSNSGVLRSEIVKWGGRPVMSKVGHSFVEHAMRQHNALLGGEQSGHFFCGEEYFGFDDALVAAMRMLSILHGQNEPLSAFLVRFPKVYVEPELRPYCPDDVKGAVIQMVIEHFSATHPVETMDGARIDFGDDAWAGIRQSNTSPRISICMEARSSAALENVKKAVLDFFKTKPQVDFER